MAAIKIYMTLFRVSNLPTVWSNVLTAAILCNTPFSISLTLTVMLSMSFFYSAGMAFNDICDAEIDKISKTNRPIPLGKISILTAKKVSFFLLISAFLLLLVAPYKSYALFAAAFLAILIIFYDLYHKGNPLSVLLMAGCRFMIYITVGYGIAGKIETPIVIIALVQFAYIVFVSLIARFENKLPQGFGFPVIPFMLAAICAVDGIFLAFTISPIWIAGGIGGMLLTLAGQKYVRGD